MLRGACALAILEDPLRTARKVVPVGAERKAKTLRCVLLGDCWLMRFSKRFILRDRMAVSAVVEAFNLFDRANFSKVNNIFGRGAFPFEPQRDGQGRVDVWTVRARPAATAGAQLALRFTF
jgi:hypothetical protein